MNILQESTKNLASLPCGGAMRTIAPSMRHTIAPAALPEAHAEVLCRRRQRYKYVSVPERPPQRYGHRLKLAERTNLPLYR